MKQVRKLFDAAGILIFAAMVAVVILQVVCRFILRVSVPWTEEMSRLLFIFLCFWGVVVAVREKELIVIDTFRAKLRGRARKVLDSLISLFMAAFFAVILAGSVKMAVSVWPTRFSTMEWLSNGWLYVAAIVGSGGALVSIVLALFRETRGGGAEKKEE